MLGMIGSDIDVDTPVHKLGVAQQQIVEIAKALSQNARILVMDEPTSALSDTETEHLFGMMRRLKAAGVAIVYISHRMAEVFLLGDRITILRDGKKVATVLPNETSPGDLVQKMVGRKVDAIHRRGADIKRRRRGARRASDLTAPSGISDINLNVRAGEIVGLCGLVGSGRTEVARAIFGADRVTARRSAFLRQALYRWPGRGDAPGRRSDPGKPQGARPGADPVGRRQHRACGARQAVSVARFRSGQGRQGRRQTMIEKLRIVDAVGAARGSGSVGRQPAEGRHRQMARRPMRGFSSSTSRRAASTSAPRPRSSR